MIRQFFFCLLILASVVDVGLTYSADDLKALLTTIFTDYDTRIRPVYADQSNAVDVTVDFCIVGINSFDSSAQKLTTTGYLEIGWTDEVLQNKWNSAAIDSILIGQKNVWLPDIALQNSVESLTGLGNSFLQVEVKQSGVVTWKPFHVFESACTPDVTFFPFDKTSCDLKFVVWSNTKDLVKVTKGTMGINSTFYQESAEWQLSSLTATNYESSTSSGVTFTIELKRKPLFHLINILLPVIMLAVINAFVFVLPASSGERTGLSVTIFLAFAVFLTIISAEIPQTAEKISTFAAYLFLMTFVSTTIVIITIIQLRLFSRDPEQPIPNWLQWMSRGVRRMSRARCCRRLDGYAAFDADEIKERLAADITWTDVCNALDFVFFWFFLTLMVIITIICIVVSVTAAF